jgi:cytochrome c peroxidase
MVRLHTLLSLFLVVANVMTIATLGVSCTDNEVAPSPTPYPLPTPEFFPTDLNIPIDNPLTVEGVELGRYLFYDGRLSGRTHPDSLMSCGSCHVQANGFEVGLKSPRAPGGHPRGMPNEEYPEGKPTPHVMLPVVNLIYNSTGYTWNGFLEESNSRTTLPGYDFSEVENMNFRNLEAFTYMAIVAKHEFNGSIGRTVEVIASDPMYKPMFKKAFGDEQVTANRISKAISQFVRTIISYRSRYHQWLRGETSLTDSELRGYELYFSEEADCFHCHGGVMLTNNLYFNNAKDAVFTDERDRFAITGHVWDIGAYRAPSLINVELNGPYMHDGRFQTLDEVIDFYSEGLVISDYVHPLMKNVNAGGVDLTTEEKADLKAFLLTFTDHDLLTDPSFASPDALGSWTVGKE